MWIVWFLLYQCFYEVITKKHDACIQRKMYILNACFCMVSILSALLYEHNSSLLYAQSIGYGCLKDASNGDELDMWFKRSIKGIVSSWISYVITLSEVLK